MLFRDVLLNLEDAIENGKKRTEWVGHDVRPYRLIQVLKEVVIKEMPHVIAS
jgi:hypothetical protein